ncbi:hypothetical protein STSP2_00078 [Anaerohalosphaera lusitana]|uniref:Uncharacterized protein n=1 Tax=Anaerohalosphaera lusitana TaxID=1936003 RepID=A0A1U9NH62_9BACT|nr:hypothetical protein [Anaerohalosphaera lusitana]AQT66940.1 hypothetical protein STSP2_00078 [Anaerohalosphaera lusitana]
MNINPANRISTHMQDLLNNDRPGQKSRNSKALESTIGKDYSGTIERARNLGTVDRTAVAQARSLLQSGELETRQNIEATARRILTVGL